MVDQGDSDQLRLGFTELSDNITLYEYAVLVTSLEQEILTIAQLYRDRADCENNFDELKNHWGWGGFTTQDLKRCRSHGADHRLDLQLVESVCSPGQSAPAYRSHYQSSPDAASGWKTNSSC